MSKMDNGVFSGNRVTRVIFAALVFVFNLAKISDLVYGNCLRKYEIAESINRAKNSLVQIKKSVHKLWSQAPYNCDENIVILLFPGCRGAIPFVAIAPGGWLNEHICLLASFHTPKVLPGFCLLLPGELQRFTNSTAPYQSAPALVAKALSETVSPMSLSLRLAHMSFIIVFIAMIDRPGLPTLSSSASRIGSTSSGFIWSLDSVSAGLHIQKRHGPLDASDTKVLGLLTLESGTSSSLRRRR